MKGNHPNKIDREKRKQREREEEGERKSTPSGDARGAEITCKNNNGREYRITRPLFYRLSRLQGKERRSARRKSGCIRLYLYPSDRAIGEDICRRATRARAPHH